jgi:hypothetical protein
MKLLEWVPEGLNTGALSSAKASSSRTRDNSTSYKAILPKDKSIAQTGYYARDYYSSSTYLIQNPYLRVLQDFA